MPVRLYTGVFLKTSCMPCCVYFCRGKRPNLCGKRPQLCYYFICTAIHDAANISGVIPKRSFTLKPYWCPEHNALRDRKMVLVVTLRS